MASYALNSPVSSDRLSESRSRMARCQLVTCLDQEHLHISTVLANNRVRCLRETDVSHEVQFTQRDCQRTRFFLLIHVNTSQASLIIIPVFFFPGTVNFCSRERGRNSVDEFVCPLNPIRTFEMPEKINPIQHRIGIQKN
jgi:hypothetical protein